MLPGVECARRRRIHRSSNRLIDSSSSSVTSTSSFEYSSRRPTSLCLYVANRYESPRLSSMEQRNPTIRRQRDFDEKLDDAAREAKERLDEKLNASWKSAKTGGTTKSQQTHTEVSRATKSLSSRIIRWAN